MSVFSTFFIIVYNDTQTRTEEAVMTEYHWKMIESVDFFNSAEMIVRKHDKKKRKNDYILLFKKI